MEAHLSPFNLFSSSLLRLFLFLVSSLASSFSTLFLLLRLASSRFDDNDKVASGGRSRDDHLCDCCHPPPFMVVRFIKKYGARLDGRRLSAMTLGGDVRKIRDVYSAGLRDTAMGAWIKWWHWKDVERLILHATIQRWTICTSAALPPFPGASYIC